MTDSTAGAGPSASASQPVKARRYRTLRETLGSIIIGFELVVIFLATLVFFGMRILPPAVALGGGAALLALMVFTVWALRYPWGITAGWVLHLLILATGLLHAGMFIVGGLGFAMWIFAMVQGAKIDRERAPAIAEYRRRLAAGEIDPEVPVSEATRSPDTDR